MNISPQQANYASGTEVNLTAIPDAGNSFIGWSGSATGISNPTTITMDWNKSVTAIFGLGFPVALDTQGLNYTFGGNGSWFGQVGTTHDGVDACQSGVIGNNQESWFETIVIGPGNLSFWWKVSSESYSDYLEFYIDGELQGPFPISGTVDWTQKFYAIPIGSHTLRWRYMKDYSVSTGSDAGWVDQIVWTPDGQSFASWQSTQFTPEQLADPLDSGPNADADHDGLKNLIEFAYGLDPNSGSSIQVPQPQRVGENYVINFAEPAGIAGVTYGADWSPTLDPGSWLPLPDTGSGGNHIFSVPIGSYSEMFMRLKVSGP